MSIMEHIEAEARRRGAVQAAKVERHILAGDYDFVYLTDDSVIRYVVPPWSRPVMRMKVEWAARKAQRERRDPHGT